MLNVQVLDKHEDNVDGWNCLPGEELSSIVYWLFSNSFHNEFGLHLGMYGPIQVEKDYEDVYSVSQNGRFIYGIYFEEKN